MESAREGPQVEKQWLKLKLVLKDYGFGGIDEKVKRIDQYVEMIFGSRDWAGLTSRSLRGNIEEVIAESLAVFSATNCEQKTVIEIGSGGGLLGIVVSIACPEWMVTMTERSSRKAAFLTEAVGSMSINNAEVFHGEAQGLAGERVFDLCLSRASGRLIEVAPIALSLLRPGGKYIAIKQKKVEGELEEARGIIKARGGRVPDAGSIICEPAVQAGGVSLVVIEKL